MSRVRKGLLTAPDTLAALVQLQARASGRRPKGRHYLIACEGTKTEPNYFEALRLRLSGGEADKVVVVGAQNKRSEHVCDIAPIGTVGNRPCRASILQMVR